MSSYVPPHLRKNNFTRPIIQPSTHKKKIQEKQFTLTENEFPTIISNSEKKNIPLPNIVLENSFVKVATTIVEIQPNVLVEEQSYDKTIYKKKHFLKKKPSVVSFPPRQYSDDGWMENNDFIDWFEYNFPNRVGTF
jgi:hypothetical protein